MGLVVVGSIALDSVETPFGKRKEILGGSATFFSLSASFFSDVDLVAVVGSDFPDRYVRLLKDNGVGIGGLSVAKGKTFRWEGRYDYDLNTAHTIYTHLNVFETFKPEIPRHLRESKFLFFG